MAISVSAYGFAGADGFEAPFEFVSVTVTATIGIELA
jgi:hypothetical protein